MPRSIPTTFRRSLLVGAGLLLATLSCGREVTGPPGFTLVRDFSFSVRFDTPGLANGVASDLVPFDRVRVRLVNSTGEQVVDRMVPFPSGADSVSLALTVPVANAAGAEGERMQLALAFVNAQGDTVFLGSSSVQVVAGGAPSQPQVPVRYAGPGAEATTVEIAPGITTILSGDPFGFTAAARDAQGQPIAAPIAWRTSDTTKARITAPGAGAGTTLPARGPVAVIAQLLTGPADTVLLDITPRAQAVQVVSGNNQAAVQNAALPLPLVVRVVATDGQPMAGVAVAFAVASGGGSVSAPSVLSDANGLAQVTWTAGPGFGAQTVTATATGLVGSPLTFTATAPNNILLHHYQFASDASDGVGTADASLFGNAQVLDGALVLDGATAYAEMPSAIVPTSGSYAVSLWARVRTPDQGTLLSQGTAGGPGLFLSYDQGLGQEDVGVGEGGGLSGVASPGADGLFHHLVLVVDAAANTTRVYQDGAVVATFNTAIIPAAGGTPTRLGRMFDLGADYFNGDLDELRVYAGPLTAAEVTALRALGPTAPDRLVFGVQPQPTAAGATMPAFTVRAEDARGQLRTAFTGPVTISPAPGRGNPVVTGTTTVNAVGGIATFSTIAIQTVGAGYAFDANASGFVPAQSAPFAITAGAATALAFVVEPTAVQVNAAIAPPVQVRVRDAGGNTVTGFNGNVTIALGANPGGATLGGTTTATVVGGIATFSTLSLSAVGTGYTLVASSAGLANATSAAFDVTAAGGGINSWTNAAGGDWTTGTNWSLGRAPIALDTVRLDAVGTYVVQLPGTVAVTRLEVGGTGGRNATLALQAGAALTTTGGVLNNGAGIIDLGAGATVSGAPVQNNGLIRSNGGSIAADFLNNGSFDVFATSTLTGAVATTSISAILIQSSVASGSMGLSVQNGFTNQGQLTLTSSGGAVNSGLAVVTGDLVNAGSGTITFAAGTGGQRTYSGRLVNLGTITTTAVTSWALDGGTNTNDGSITAGAQLSLGISGGLATFSNTGTITIASGQVLGLTTGTFLQESGAGVVGGGTLAVTPAAALRLLESAIGANVANSGLVEATGASAIGGTFTMNTGAVLRVGAIGSFTAPSSFVLNSGLTNSGTIELTNQATVAGAYGAALQFSAGSLTNAVGGVVRTSAGNGGGARAIGGAVLNQGLLDVAPGAAGTLSITGNLTASTGTIAVDIGGLTAGAQYDQLLVSGTATLGGTLNVGLFGGYTPTAGTSFTLLTAGTRTGTFATVNAAAPLQAAPTYSATDVLVLGPTAGVVNAWTNTAGGNWSAVANWSQGRTPIATDTVSIAAAGTYTVTMDVGDTVSALFVGGGAGVQTLAVGARTLQVDGDATVASSGVLTIATGGILRGAGGLLNQGQLTTGAGSVQKAVQNAGTVLARAASAFTQPFTNANGAMLRISGETATGAASVTFGNGIDNAGAIELVATGAAYSVQLTVTAGSILNQPTGTIAPVAGVGGTRILSATLINQGTVNIPFDLAITGASAAHVNSGTITMTAGDLTITQSGTTPSFTNTGTIATNARTLTVNGGALDLLSGVVTGTGGGLVTTGATTVRFTSGTVQPRVRFGAGAVFPDAFTIPAGDSLRINGGVFAPPSLQNDGTLILEGATTITTAVTTGTGSTIRVRGSGAGGSPTATFTNPLTNSATLDLFAQDAAYTVTLVTPSLTNTASGTIATVAGVGGVRVLNTTLINQGTVNIPFDLAITGASAAHVNSGTIAMTAGDLTITQSGTTPSFTNTGTIATNGRTFTVAGGTLDLTGGVVTGYGGRLVTTGSPTVRFTVPTVQPRVTLSATSTLPDPFVVPAGDSLRILGGGFAPPSLTNNGTLILEGAPTINTAVTTGTGSTIRVRGSGAGGNPTATFTNPLTNSATLDLFAQDAAYTVTLVTPSLTNTASGTFATVAGVGGTRVLNATLINQGTLNIPFDLAITGASAAHVNSGTITMTAGDLTVTQSGTTPSFTNTGTIATNGRTFTVAGGTLDLTGGVVTGYGGRLVTTGSPTVRFTVPTVQPRVTLSATSTLPDPFVVPVGDSLRILGGGFAPPSLTNNGTLILEGAPTINTAVTTGTGSTIRVRGSGAGGNPTATFTNPLTNSATLDLFAQDAGYTVTLVTPSLTNTASGTFATVAGVGGTRVLNATLINQGTVNIPYDLSITGASAAHVNSGTITLTTGDLTVTQSGTTPSFTNTGTIATNGRTLTVAGGTLDLTGGVVTGYGGRLVTTGSPTVRFTVPTVQPRVTLSATSTLPDPFVVPAGDSLRILGGGFAPPSLTNNGTLILEGAPTINTAVTTGTGSTIRVRGSGAGGNPTATFTNPLTNSATLDLFAQDAGYTVTLVTPSLTNTASGTFATVAGVGGTRVLNATLINQGTVNIPYDLSITGASAAHVNSGTITLTTGDLTVTQSGTTPSFTNTGTIAAGARTLTFAGGTVDLTAGSVSGVGALVSTTGTTALLLAPAQVQPRLNLSAATTIPMALTIGATDSLRVRGTFAPTTLTNNGSLLLEGTTTVNTALTSGVGSSILVRGITASGAANVTFANGFTNNGLFRIIAQDAAYAVAANFGVNTLTNAANGTIDLALGSNGSRTLTAALVDNSGAFTANFNGTVTGTIAQRGTLTVAATRSLTVSGLTTLFAGSTTTATGTLTLTGGCSNQGGTFTGFTCP